MQDTSPKNNLLDDHLKIRGDMHSTLVMEGIEPKSQTHKPIVITTEDFDHRVSLFRLDRLHVEVYSTLNKKTSVQYHSIHITEPSPLETLAPFRTLIIRTPIDVEEMSRKTWVLVDELKIIIENNQRKS